LWFVRIQRGAALAVIHKALPIATERFNSQAARSRSIAQRRPPLANKVTPDLLGRDARAIASPAPRLLRLGISTPIWHRARDCTTTTPTVTRRSSVTTALLEDAQPPSRLTGIGERMRSALKA